MGALDEIRDPLGAGVAAMAAATAAASGLPAAASVGVGGAVLAVKTLTGVLLDRRAPPAAPPAASAGATSPVGPAPVTPGPGPAAAFRLEGDYWTIRYRGGIFRLKDSKGLRHLHRLLADPGREFHATDLAAMGERPLSDARADAGALLDPEAKAAYRRRLEDLREQAAEAEAWGDPERAVRAEAEISALAKELSRAVGMGGRDRRAGSPSERARLNVTRAVRSAMERIAEHDCALGRHLSATVRTGTFCIYAPDPDDMPSWEL